jgi:hypothetical protein
VQNQEIKRSPTPVVPFLALGVFLIVLGITLAFTSDPAWLGGIVCALGVVWLFLGWRPGRR